VTTHANHFMKCPRSSNPLANKPDFNISKAIAKRCGQTATCFQRNQQQPSDMPRLAVVRRLAV